MRKKDGAAPPSCNHACVLRLASPALPSQCSLAGYVPRALGRGTGCGGGLRLPNVLYPGLTGELYASPVLRVSGTGGREAGRENICKSPGAGAYPPGHVHTPPFSRLIPALKGWGRERVEA